MKSIHSLLFCFLAQGQVPNPMLPDKPRGASVSSVMSREVMAVLGIILALALVLFIWAFFIRKRKPVDPHLRAIEPGPTLPEPAESSGGAHRHRHHRRHRHRHRKRDGSHSQRNPTLQETGGLPPYRPDDAPPDF